MAKALLSLLFLFNISELCALTTEEDLLYKQLSKGIEESVTKEFFAELLKNETKGKNSSLTTLINLNNATKNHDLLGVPEKSSEEAIKKAYFNRVHTIHPDTIWNFIESSNKESLLKLPDAIREKLKTNLKDIIGKNLFQKVLNAYNNLIPATEKIFVPINPPQEPPPQTSKKFPNKVEAGELNKEIQEILAESKKNSKKLVGFAKKWSKISSIPTAIADFISSKKPLNDQLLIDLSKSFIDSDKKFLPINYFTDHNLYRHGFMIAYAHSTDLTKFFDMQLRLAKHFLEEPIDIPTLDKNINNLKQQFEKLWWMHPIEMKQESILPNLLSATQIIARLTKSDTTPLYELVSITTSEHLGKALAVAEELVPLLYTDPKKRSDMTKKIKRYQKYIPNGVEISGADFSFIFDQPKFLLGTPYLDQKGIDSAIKILRDSQIIGLLSISYKDELLKKSFKPIIDPLNQVLGMRFNENELNLIITLALLGANKDIHPETAQHILNITTNLLTALSFKIENLHLKIKENVSELEIKSAIERPFFEQFVKNDLETLAKARKMIEEGDPLIQKLFEDQLQLIISLDTQRSLTTFAQSLQILSTQIKHLP